jgi:hypothetical protein
MGRAGRASERAPSFPARIGMRPTPALCQPPPSRAGPARWHRAPLTCSSLPQSRAAQAVRTRDVSAATPAEPRLPARIGPAQAPNGALSSAANDASTGRSRPQSQGGSQPPRSNGQAFDEARNPVTVAGCRRCRASGRVRPRWDQAFPCYFLPCIGGGGAIGGAIGGAPACRRASSAWFSCAVVSVPDLGPWAWSIW